MRHSSRPFVDAAGSAEGYGGQENLSGCDRGFVRDHTLSDARHGRLGRGIRNWRTAAIHQRQRVEVWNGQSLGNSPVVPFWEELVENDLHGLLEPRDTVVAGFLCLVEEAHGDRGRCG
jgi:hypothetical protein